MGKLFSAIFLPGLPGEKKDYKFLKDLTLAEAEVYWLTYTGSYENKDQDEFSYENCLKDIRTLIDKLERSGQAYMIIAYSFSTFLLRKIDLSSLKHCEAVFMFSPILSLRSQDIKSDFQSLLNYLMRENKVVRVGSDWDLITQGNKNESQLFSKWLSDIDSYHIPTFIFTSYQDESGLSETLVNKLAEPYKNKGTSIQLIESDEATHKLDSYYTTVAHSYLWAVIAKIKLSRLTEGIHFYIWGSLLDKLTWTRYSDIDILAIGTVRVKDYSEIAKVSVEIEKMGGIHLGISLNDIEDLNRNGYIRRNRGPIFIYELAQNAISFGKPLSLPIVSHQKIKEDSLNTNRILRAEIQKQLLRYYTNPLVAKHIVKSFLQSARLLQYCRGAEVATFEAIFEQEPWLQELITYCIEAKRSNYKNITFTRLHDMYIAIDRIVEIQEGLSI